MLGGAGNDRFESQGGALTMVGGVGNDVQMLANTVIQL